MAQTEIKYHHVTNEILATVKAGIKAKYPKFADTPPGVFVGIRYMVQIAWAMVGSDLVITVGVPAPYLSEAQTEVRALIDPLVPPECRGA